MIIAAAQFLPEKGNVDSNLKQHYHFIETAAKHGVDLLLFPEMSITGYIHEEADNLAFSVDDNRLETLSQMAMEYGMTIVGGAPLRHEENLYIASFILNPDGSTNIYRKHFLHGNEVLFFQPAPEDYQSSFSIKNKRVAFAICADITHRKHAETAAIAQPDLYVASIFFSKKGIGEAYEKLGNYARDFKFNVLMSNFSDDHLTPEPAGRSAYWNRSGELIAALDNNRGLLIVDTSQKKSFFISFDVISDHFLASYNL